MVVFIIFFLFSCRHGCVNEKNALKSVRYIYNSVQLAQNPSSAFLFDFQHRNFPLSKNFTSLRHNELTRRRHVCIYCSLLDYFHHFSRFPFVCFAILSPVSRGPLFHAGFDIVWGEEITLCRCREL